MYIPWSRSQAHTSMSDPATQAVRKQAMDPAMKALWRLYISSSFESFLKRVNTIYEV